jgi:hypothetical protein
LAEVLAVRLTPRGGRDAVDGWALDADGRPYLKVRVASPPVDGAANAALLAFLAKTLKIPALGGEVDLRRNRAGQAAGTGRRDARDLARLSAHVPEARMGQIMPQALQGSGFGARWRRATSSQPIDGPAFFHFHLTLRD